MDIKTQTLAQFVTEESLRLAAFEKWWRKQHAANPTVFPLDLEPGMWDESLQMFDPAEIEPEQASGEQDTGHLTVKGVKINADQQRACLKRMREGLFRAKDVANAAYEAGVYPPAVADRVADRLIQREKKSGRIELQPGNNWKWVAP